MAAVEPVELPVASEAFLTHLVVEKGRAPLTLDAYRRDLRRWGQFEARLVERFARLHDFGAEPDRLAARLWIRQPGREVRRVERVKVAGGGIDQDVDSRPDGVRPLFAAEQSPFRRRGRPSAADPKLVL